MTSRIEPIAEEGGMIKFGRSGLNVKSAYGIDPVEFLDIHSRIVEMGLKTPFEEASVYIIFDLFCNELINLGFDIIDLISEFNKAQGNNWEDTAHALSLAKLCYHYKRSGFDVKIVKTSTKLSTPDLSIDGIACDLKVRHDQHNRKMMQYKQLLKEDAEKYHDIYFDKIRDMHEDLILALENRSVGGFSQAECLIFDLSNHFHTWNYHRIRSYINKQAIRGISKKPLKPVPGSCIIFSPDNAQYNAERSFEPRAYWGYIFWDSTKREFINP